VTQIYDIEMGTRAPSIQQIRVHSVRLDDEKKEIDSVNFDLDVDYSGGLGIAIDVTLAYGKSAHLSAKGILFCSFLLTPSESRPDLN